MQPKRRQEIHIRNFMFLQHANLSPRGNIMDNKTIKILLLPTELTYYCKPSVQSYPTTSSQFQNIAKFLYLL